MVRRTVLATALSVLVAGLIATSASGHAGSPDYESLVRAVAPSIPGFSVEVLNGDDRLELVNASKKNVTVYGYNKEPYLRLGPDGAVSVNLRSPAYYLNQDRFTGGKVPDTADAKAAPQWSVVERGGRYQFHDHRMHWMAKTVPPQVKDKSKRTKIFDWAVPLRVGQTPATIEGQLFWRGSAGGPPAGAYIALGALLLLGVATVVVVRRRRAGAASGPAPPSGEAW
ncbi:MAG: hypothetical protein QOI48_1430 [Solirubrobacteraceae bacterium]|jgi:hypothetical protein|nr:hypothetical protein [Solirubrobacteraceae bacterium]